MNEAIRLYRQKRFAEALNVLLSLHVSESEETTLSYYLGLCYTHLGKFDEALLYLEQVLASEVDFLQVYQSRMIMGYIYAVTGRHRLAEFELNRLLEDGYESAKVYAALAYAVYAQGKTAPAIADLEKALTIDPGNVNALNSLGYILAENEVRLDYALECCTRAVMSAPDNASYLDSLALVHWKRGDLKQAKQLYEKAVRLSKGNAELVGHYKELLRTAGIDV
jgi:tetratricopeptide (TPR) repeat protein